MITRNEKAKGLWWRLLATLPVLALLMIANTKVAAQEQQSDRQDIRIEIGQFEIYDDNGLPMNLSDTTIYNEDGSYIRFETAEAPDPISGEMRNRVSVVCYNADGTLNEDFQFHLTAMETHRDTTLYTVEPFSISSDNFRLSIQTTEENPVRILEKSNDSIYQIVNEMPKFPGGEQAMMKFVAQNVKYPEKAKDEGISGRVFISFVVEKDGSISNVEVKRGIGGGCDEEAVRVISSMPKWKPGMHKGEPVRVSYQMPIMFKLGQTNDENKTTVKTVVAGDDEHSWKASTATIPDNPAKDNMKPDKNGVYQIVEEMPSFPGGDRELMEHIAKNIKYPQEAMDKEIQGRVFVSFVVEKDGSVSNVELKRGIGGGCDEEAIRVISTMPKWNPGKMKGEPVRVSYMMPINFKLTEKQPEKK